MIHITNVFILAPDILADDGVFSGLFYSLYDGGYQSVLYQQIPILFNSSVLSPAYTVVGQTFFIVNPRNMSDNDIIPPARIADLRVVNIDETEQKATVEFTEPGDDFMDNGGRECARTRLIRPNLIIFSSLHVLHLLWSFNLQCNICV